MKRRLTAVLVISIVLLCIAACGKTQSAPSVEQASEASEASTSTVIDKKSFDEVSSVTIEESGKVVALGDTEDKINKEFGRNVFRVDDKDVIHSGDSSLAISYNAKGRATMISALGDDGTFTLFDGITLGVSRASIEAVFDGIEWEDDGATLYFDEAYCRCSKIDAVYSLDFLLENGKLKFFFTEFIGDDDILPLVETDPEPTTSPKVATEKNVDTSTPKPSSSPRLTPMEQACADFSAIYDGDSRLQGGEIREFQNSYGNYLKVRVVFNSSVTTDKFQELVQEVTDNIMTVCDDNGVLCLDNSVILLTQSGFLGEKIEWGTDTCLEFSDNEHLLHGHVTDTRNSFEIIHDVHIEDISSVLLSDEEIQAQKDAEAAIPIEAKSAVQKAKDYLKIMAFSYDGLVDQLEYEGYSYENAVYGVDNCGADWYEQAVKKAKSYLDIMSFSRDGLISQLEYEGFTHDQAVYGAEQNGY